MNYKTLRKIIGTIAAACFFFAYGIIGGIEHGEPLVNALYLIPSLGVGSVCCWLLG